MDEKSIKKDRVFILVIGIVASNLLGLVMMSLALIREQFKIETVLVAFALFVIAVCCILVLGFERKNKYRWLFRNIEDFR